MYDIANNIAGVTNEYQTSTEERLRNEEAELFDKKMSSIEDFEEYCEKNKLPKTAETFKEAYLRSSDHIPAQFFSGYKNVFGITEYSKDAYLKVMNNESPISKEQLAKINPNLKTFNSDTDRLTRKTKNEKKGLDTVATVPKSVSQHYAISSEEDKAKILKAFQSSVSQFLEEIKHQAKPSTAREEYQGGTTEIKEWFVTGFCHTDTRPGEKDKTLSKEQIAETIDPDLHYHLEIAQFGVVERTVIDKKTGEETTITQTLALDFENLFKNQKENSALFDTLMNSNLQKEGFVTEPHEVVNPLTGELTNTYKIKGYTREEELLQSNRSQSIYDEMKRQNKTRDPKLQQQIAKGYKNGKINLTAKEMAKAIKENTNRVLGADKYQKVKDIQAKSKQEYTKAKSEVIYGLDKFDKNGFASATELRTAITRQIMFEKTFNNPKELKALVDSKITELQNTRIYGKDSLIEVKNAKGVSMGYTKMDFAIHERSFVKNVNTLMTNKVKRSQEEIIKDNQFLEDFKNRAKAKGFEYNIDQVRAMEQVLKLDKESGKVLMIVGDPGSGKTSSVIKMASELHTHRYGKGKVFGVSVAESATADLKSAGIPKDKLLNSTVLIQNAYKVDDKGNYTLNQAFVNKNQNAMFIFDEFGMCGIKDASLITNLAIACNGSMLQVGDHKQLASVNAGAAYKTAKETIELEDRGLVKELTIIQRQKNTDALKVVELARDKDAEGLFDHLEKHDALRTAKTEKTLFKKIADDYLDRERSSAELKERFIVVPKHDQIDKINDVIREKIKKDNLDPTVDFSTEKAIEVARKSGNGQDIVRERNFAVGEQVVFLQNYKEKDKSGKNVKDGWKIQNSQTGIIKDIQAKKDGSFDLSFDVDGQDININSNQYNYFNHSHAISTHKSQGKTREDVLYVMDPSISYNNAFVGLSRHTGTEDIKDEQGNVIQKGEIGVTAYVLEKDIEEVKVAITEEQKKFTTLKNEQIDKAVNEYVNEQAREDSKDNEPPVHIQKEIDKNLMLNEMVELNNQVQIQEEIHTNKNNLEFTEEEKAKINKIVNMSKEDIEALIKDKEELNKEEIKEVQTIEINKDIEIKKEIDDLQPKVSTKEEVKDNIATIRANKVLPKEDLVDNKAIKEEVKNALEQAKIYSAEEIKAMPHQELNKIARNPEIYKANFEVLKETQNPVYMTNISNHYLTSIKDKEELKEELLKHKELNITNEHTLRLVAENGVLDKSDKKWMEEYSNGIQTDQYKNGVIAVQEYEDKVKQQSKGKNQSLEEVAKNIDLDKKEEVKEKSTKEIWLENFQKTVNRQPELTQEQQKAIDSIKKNNNIADEEKKRQEEQLKLSAFKKGGLIK